MAWPGVRDYAGEAIRYAERVVAGEIPTCSWTNQAAARFLGELEDSRAGRFPFTFEPSRVELACSFVELLPHVKGRGWKGGGTIVLEPWQTFILANVFGWVDDLGFRRFRVAYIEVPRKNGKSTFTAPVGLYMLADDEEPGAEVYSAATTRDQARIIFQMCRTMARRAPRMCDVYGIHVGAHRLSVERSASWLEALSSDAHSLDGLNPHFAMIDELHAHRSRDVWDVLESAIGAREQPLLWAITTAGYDRTGVCYEVREYVTKVLTGTVVDLRTFGIIYTADNPDAWDEELEWQKANPNLGVSVKLDDMRRMARKAQEQPAALNTFLTKRLNVWVSASTAWMDMRRWHECADHDLVAEEFEGRRAFIGVDLSSKVDLAAAALIIPPLPADDGEDPEPWRMFWSFWIPEAKLEDTSVAQMSGWERDGWLTAVPGPAMDFSYVDAEVRDWCRRFDVGAIGYDPWQAHQMATAWTADRLPAVEVPMRVSHLSEPMKELERMVYTGELEHSGDPVMAWCVSNTVAKLDANDNVFPRKERPTNKIDGLVATLIGLSRALVDDGPGGSIYETRGIRAI